MTWDLPGEETASQDVLGTATLHRSPLASGCPLDCLLHLKTNFSSKTSTVNIYQSPGNDARLVFPSLHKRGT